MVKKCSHIIFTIAIFTCLIFTPGIKAEEISSIEYKVKAAFLYNFAKFTKWPDDVYSNSKSPFIICIIGQTPLKDSVNIIEKKKIGKRKVLIHFVNDISSVKKCHMLYVAKSKKKKLESIILPAMENKPVLTVSDIDGFVNSGGIIELVRKGENIQFAINLYVAKASGIVISSQILKLALNVIK